MEHCEHFMELLSQSLDGPLSQSDQQALQQHLDACPECRLLSQQLFEIQNEFHTWEEQDVPAGFTEGIMDRIRALEEAPKVVPLWKHPQVKLLGSIAACALICVGIWRMGTPNVTEDLALSTETAAPAAAASEPISYGINASAAADHAEPNTKQGQAPAEAAVPSPTSLDGLTEDYADQSSAAYSFVVRSETAPPTEEELIQTVLDTINVAPGTLFLVDTVPDTVKETAACHTSENGFVLYVLEDVPADDLMQTYRDNALLTLSSGTGPIVFLITD